MTKYALYAKQDGEGCDYTIGCGALFVKLKSETLEEARIEIHDIVEDYSLGRPEREIEEMYLVEIKEGLDVEEFMSEDDEEDAATKLRRAQYERLKQEFG